MKALPYVYICREKNSPKTYIGYRYANYDNASLDFGIKYFTSNKYVRENFDNFEHTIVAEFYNKADAYAFEAQLIKEYQSEHLINSQRINNRPSKYKPKVKFELETQTCALQGCNKTHRNWRHKCCCLQHHRTYSGQRAHAVNQNT